MPRFTGHEREWEALWSVREGYGNFEDPQLMTELKTGVQSGLYTWEDVEDASNYQTAMQRGTRHPEPLPNIEAAYLIEKR